MLNVVIPMAGAGSRFSDAGFRKPKPFIDVCGKIMIERVLQNLATTDSRFILIVRKEHLSNEAKAIGGLEKEYGCKIITVDKMTEGAACTILLSSQLIDNNDPLLLANSDQIVEMDIENFIADSRERELDGSILTFNSNHPKWSYAKIDREGYLIELKEKEPISKHATVGLYYFQKGKDFINSAKQMIANNDRVNNEFYTAPAYNYSLKLGLRIGIYGIEESQMFGLGTPEDLEQYIEHLKNEDVNNEDFLS